MSNNTPSNELLEELEGKCPHCRASTMRLACVPTTKDMVWLCYSCLGTINQPGASVELTKADIKIIDEHREIIQSGDLC